MNHTYIRTYITDALNEATLTEPDSTQADKHFQTLKTLYQAHQERGVEGAKEAWRYMVNQNPSLVELQSEAPNRLLHYSELAKQPAVDWLIEGMIPAASLIEIHGQPGHGKTLFALDLAIRISGNRTAAYVTGEGGRGMYSRIEAWSQHHKAEVGKLFFWKKPVNLADPNAVDKFIPILKESNPDIIFFDTLARCMVGVDENSASSMGVVIDNCGRLIRQFNTSVVLVHHTGKKTTQERGSSALRGACDTMIHVEKQDSIVTIRNVKQKDAKPFNQFKKVILDVNFELEIEGEIQEIESVVIAEATDERMEVCELSDHHLQILEAMNQSIYRTDGTRAKDVENDTGLSGGTLTRAMSWLKEHGYIMQIQPRQPYYITDTGRDLLQKSQAN